MSKQIMIADSGSTKTDWSIVGDSAFKSVKTQGINPFMLDIPSIEKILREELLPFIDSPIDDVFFYGAGCKGEKCKDIELALASTVSPTHSSFVASDLFGAARALCGSEEGIACILGTGSNSCLFDGENIQQNVSPLGYVLGDEGSGAVLGRRLVADVLKKQLSDEVCRLFWNSYHPLTEQEVIHRIYREPLANRFLASFAPFLGKYRYMDEIHYLILEEFSRFFRRNVLQYGTKELPVHFVGSIAFYLKPELEEAASAFGLHVGKVLKTPIEGLVDYHLSLKG